MGALLLRAAFQVQVKVQVIPRRGPADGSGRSETDQRLNLTVPYFGILT